MAAGLGFRVQGSGFRVVEALKLSHDSQETMLFPFLFFKLLLCIHIMQMFKRRFFKRRTKVLVYGVQPLGIPAMGVDGAAWATALSIWIACICFAVLLSQRGYYQKVKHMLLY